MGWFADQTMLAADEIFKRLKLDTNPIYSPRFRKFVKWLGYSVIPFIFNIATILVMLWLFNRIYLKLGFEPTAIALLVLIWAKSQK